MRSSWGSSSVSRRADGVGIFAFKLYQIEKNRMRVRAETMDISYINRRVGLLSHAIVCNQTAARRRQRGLQAREPRFVAAHLKTLIYLAAIILLILLGSSTFHLGYSVDGDPNASISKGLNKNKNPSDDKSFTSRKTKAELGESWASNKDDQDMMEANKWNLKKLSFTPKTGRITERRCGLHGDDPEHKHGHDHNHSHRHEHKHLSLIHI